MLLIDTHAHLFFDDFEDRLEEVIARAEAAGVAAIVCAGIDLPTSEKSIQIAERYPQVTATVGVHPHDAKDAPEDTIKRLEELAAHEKVAALGEMGLDYYRNLSPPEVQREVFRAQLELAAALNLPVVVHNRQADEDLYALLTEVGHARGVAHCFSSAPDFARKLLDFGFHISFTGTVTYGNRQNAAVLQRFGLERVMVETDSPFLAPVPHRGKTNEPAYVRHTAEKIAEICELPLEEVARITTATAEGLFGPLLPTTP
jgi:TatD DNase family protein